MRVPSKANRQLIEEIDRLKQKIAQLEKAASESKPVERPLHDIEDRFNAFMDNTPNVAWMKDDEGRYVYINKSYERRFGVKTDSWLGKTDFDIWPREIAEGYRQNDRIVLETGRTVETTETAPDANGNTTYWRKFKFLCKDTQGRKYVAGGGIDVTESKRLEERLQEERDVLQAVMDGARRSLLAYLDRDFNYIRVNEAFAAACGLRPDDLIGRNQFVLYPHAESEAIFTRVRDTGEPFEIRDYPFTFSGRAERRTAHWDWMLAPVKDADGKVGGLVLSLFETTERKRAEEEMRRSKALLESVFNSSQDLMVVVDRDLRILISNWKSPLYAGKKEYPLGSHCYEAFLKRGQICEPCFAMNVFNSGKPLLAENYNPVTKRLVEVSSYPIFDDRGEVVMVAEHVRDITDRRRTEAALRDREAQFSVMFEVASIGMAQADVATGQWLRVNQKMCDITGYSPDELLTMRIQEITHPEDRDRDWDLFQKVVRGELPDYRLEKRYIRKDGRTVWINVNMAVIRDDRGRATRTMATIEDITDRKRMEQESREMEMRLQRSEKMEALGLLAGGVAHDLNNELGILVGYAELLHDNLDESDPRKGDARNIMSGGERAAAIVQDLLTLARRGVQTKTVVNLNKTVTEYLKSPEHLRLAALHPHIRVETRLDDDLLMIRGSRVHISKTLMNLVSNAAEAMSSGGDIVIRTENRYLDRPVAGYDDMGEGDYVVLAVSDEGEGISDKDMKRIFEPFYTKKVMGRSGTGLGLSVVWGTVKDHGGHIDVQSKRGRGTTFSLYFPVTREEAAGQDDIVPSDLYRGRGERILVVDDVKDQRDLAARILESLNYIVDTAASGEAAVAFLRNSRADLVVLDMIMDPGIDGFETYRRITEIHPRQKAVIVSGFAETDRVKMAQSLGVGAFVRKPYVKERIGLAIRNELDGK